MVSIFVSKYNFFFVFVMHKFLFYSSNKRQPSKIRLINLLQTEKQSRGRYGLRNIVYEQDVHIPVQICADSV